MNQLGHWNGHWDCGTDKEKLQVALFSTKLFTEERIFFFKLFFILFSFFPNEGTRYNLWFMAFCSLLEFFFFKVEKTSFIIIINFFFSIHTCFSSSLLCRSWNDKCQLLHFFFTPLVFFVKINK